MKKLFLTALLLTTVSCEKVIKRLDTPKEATQVMVQTEASFTGDPSNDARLQGVELDLESVPLNQAEDVIDMLGCSAFELGSSNAGNDLGIPEGTMIIESDNNGKSGVMRFGHLPYVHPSETMLAFADMTMKNELCALFSTESYNFEIDANGDLILYAIAPGKAWDGAASKFSRD